ncbi:MAG: hypothetical protein KBA81_04845, partial [Rhabdochlamydiaceae bacterium]|nr:hypothetical protein [Rhabdochlamydiaceae bacterium]
MAVEFKQFYDASLDIRYALRGQLFQPDLANITRIFETLREGNALSATEKIQVLDPMNQFLKRYDEESKFKQLFENPNKADLRTRTFLFEVIEALLQKYNESCYDESHRDLLAFQAIASSLHMEVLSSSVKVQATKVWQIIQRTLFPMARWGMDGPYTYAPQDLPAEYTGNRVTIIRLPVALRYDGLLAWSSISHEIGGHHFLSALPNLFLKIKDTVFEKLRNAEEIDEKYRNSLANYWSTCSLELASDVLGVRNLGPAFAIGLAGYLIGVRDELQTSGLLHSKDIKLRRALGLTFPDEKTLWISELHPDIRIPSNSGIFGKIIHNDQATEVRFTRKIIPSEKHPLDILRLCATRTLIETLINSYPERDPEKVPAEYLA